MMKRLSGPLNNLKDVVNKIPSEESMNRFLDELPRIEKILADGTLEKVAKLHVLADAFENGTIERLVSFAPLLQNIPSNTLLVDIVNMRPLLAQMPTSAELKALADRLPTPEKLDEMIRLLTEVNGFLGALRGK